MAGINGKIIHPDEIQIDGNTAYPLIDGKAFGGISWFKITPSTVKIRFDSGDVEAYDIKRLTFSGFIRAGRKRRRFKKGGTEMQTAKYIAAGGVGYTVSYIMSLLLPAL